MHPDNTDINRPNLNLRRESTASVTEQYQLLQDHIDSIRSIFQNVSAMQGPVSAAPTNQMQAPPLPQPAHWLDPVQAVQQQQLFLTQLLTCQQQLQMQQSEMQHLRNFCHDLAANQTPPPSGPYLNQVTRFPCLL